MKNKLLTPDDRPDDSKQSNVFTGIIREEDLERIDKIHSEDWLRGGEIDYNQKLVFSDDENDTKEASAPSKGGNHNKRKEQEEKEARQSEERSGMYRNF